MISGSLRNYYRDEINEPAIEIDDNDKMLNNSKTKKSKYFEIKTKIIGNTYKNDKD